MIKLVLCCKSVKTIFEYFFVHHCLSSCKEHFDSGIDVEIDNLNDDCRIDKSLELDLRVEMDKPNLSSTYSLIYVPDGAHGVIRCRSRPLGQGR